MKNGTEVKTATHTALANVEYNGANAIIAKLQLRFFNFQRRYFKRFQVVKTNR
jgi:hypothetical protein